MNYMNNLNKDFLSGGMNSFDRNSQHLKMAGSPSQNGSIMVQGMSKERTLNAQKQLLLQKQVSYLLHQKHLQEPSTCQGWSSCRGTSGNSLTGTTLK